MRTFGWVGCRMLHAKGQSTVLDRRRKWEVGEGLYALPGFDWNLSGRQNHALKTSLMPLAYLWFPGCQCLNFGCQTRRCPQNQPELLIIISTTCYGHAVCQTCAKCVNNVRSHYPQNLEQCLSHSRSLKNWLASQWVNQPTSSKCCRQDSNINLSDFKLLSHCVILLISKATIMVHLISVDWLGPRLVKTSLMQFPNLV